MYEKALEEIDIYWGSKENTKEGKYLNLLFNFVGDFEEEFYEDMNKNNKYDLYLDISGKIIKEFYNSSTPLATNNDVIVHRYTVKMISQYIKKLAKEELLKEELQKDDVNLVWYVDENDFSLKAETDLAKYTICEYAYKDIEQEFIIDIVVKGSYSGQLKVTSSVEDAKNYANEVEKYLRK